MTPETLRAALPPTEGTLRVTGLAQGIGVAETTFFIYGVGLLPVTALVGAAFASWAGLMVSLIAFTRVPEPMRTPYHILRSQEHGTEDAI